MNFNEQKKKQLKKTDLSNEGHWDKKIVTLCNKLNKNPKFYTTSSCAGRIILIKGEIDKTPDKFLFKTHNKTRLSELKNALSNIKYSGLVEFKQSPCILHVAARTIDDAEILVKKAKTAGWKHSGIMSTKKRVMVELHSTEHLDFPIMYYNKVLVNDEFLSLTIREANLRLERVWEKIDKLKTLISQNLRF